MLTKEEKKLALSSKYFGPYYGTPTDGLSPEGLVAQARGSVFEPVFDDNPILRAADLKSSEIAHTALVDVANWLGYKEVLKYLDAVGKKGKRLFKKCTIS